MGLSCPAIIIPPRVSPTIILAPSQHSTPKVGHGIITTTRIRPPGAATRQHACKLHSLAPSHPHPSNQHASLLTTPSPPAHHHHGPPPPRAKPPAPASSTDYLTARVASPSAQPSQPPQPSTPQPTPQQTTPTPPIPHPPPLRHHPLHPPLRLRPLPHRPAHPHPLGQRPPKRTRAPPSTPPSSALSPRDIVVLDGLNYIKGVALPALLRGQEPGDAVLCAAGWRGGGRGAAWSGRGG